MRNGGGLLDRLRGFGMVRRDHLVGGNGFAWEIKDIPGIQTFTCEIPLD